MMLLGLYTQGQRFGKDVGLVWIRACCERVLFIVMIYASRNPFRLASASRNKAASSDVVHEEEGVTGAVNEEHGLVVLVMLKIIFVSFTKLSTEVEFMFVNKCWKCNDSTQK